MQHSLGGTATGCGCTCSWRQQFIALPGAPPQQRAMGKRNRHRQQASSNGPEWSVTESGQSRYACGCTNNRSAVLFPAYRAFTTAFMSCNIFVVRSFSSLSQPSVQCLQLQQLHRRAGPSCTSHSSMLMCAGAYTCLQAAELRLSQT